MTSSYPDVVEDLNIHPALEQIKQSNNPSHNNHITTFASRHRVRRVKSINHGGPVLPAMAHRYSLSPSTSLAAFFCSGGNFISAAALSPLPV